MTERHYKERPRDPIHEGRQRVISILEDKSKQTAREMRKPDALPSVSDLLQARDLYVSLTRRITSLPQTGPFQINTLERAGIALHDALQERPAEVVRTFDAAYPLDKDPQTRVLGLRLLRSTFIDGITAVPPQEEALDSLPPRPDLLERAIDGYITNYGLDHPSQTFIEDTTKRQTGRIRACQQDIEHMVRQEVVSKIGSDSDELEIAEAEIPIRTAWVDTLRAVTDDIEIDSFTDIGAAIIAISEEAPLQTIQRLEEIRDENPSISQAMIQGLLHTTLRPLILRTPQKDMPEPRFDLLSQAILSMQETGIFTEASHENIVFSMRQTQDRFERTINSEAELRLISNRITPTEELLTEVQAEVTADRMQLVRIITGIEDLAFEDVGAAVIAAAYREPVEMVARMLEHYEPNIVRSNIDQILTTAISIGNQVARKSRST